MAYEFASASSQYLTAAQPLTNIPSTMAGWGYFGASASQTLVSLQNTTNSERQAIIIGTANEVIFARHTGLTVVATGTVTTNTWAHAAGSSGAVDSRSVYRDGGNKVTSNANVTLANADQLSIGARFSTTYGLFLNGRAAEVAVWSVVLTDAEITSLSKGFKPHRIRPQSLVFYAPLIRTLQDTKGALAITNNNSATVAAHPRVY